MIVISDASPIISLAAIGRLELLRDLYTQILMPTAVYEEIAVSGDGRPGAAEVKTADWIEYREVIIPAEIASASRELNAGEMEALALAQALQADLLLIDERKARAVAVRLGLKTIGILGVLLEARQRELIPDVKSPLDALIGARFFRISNDLYDFVLQSAGEAA